MRFLIAGKKKEKRKKGELLFSSARFATWTSNGNIIRHSVVTFGFGILYTLSTAFDGPI